MSNMWIDNETIALPDGHYLFRATDYCIKRSFPHGFRPNDEFGEWAIADDSGGTPETTDDGILWLDTNQRILLGKGHGNAILLPVFTPEGKRFTTATDAASLLILSDKFRWVMNVDGAMFRGVRW